MMKHGKGHNEREEGREEEGEEEEEEGGEKEELLRTLVTICLRFELGMVPRFAHTVQSIMASTRTTVSLLPRLSLPYISAPSSFRVLASLCSPRPRSRMLHVPAPSCSHVLQLIKSASPRSFMLQVQAVLLRSTASQPLNIHLLARKVRRCGVVFPSSGDDDPEVKGNQERTRHKTAIITRTNAD
ncbi:hypothetical protein O3P69_003535 [Scylla paramamosain]|uniref:Uncharacterized protein n=1 Tax=Scylla paramamosain TaxID=85552 RepID=A0AAW0UJZ9_SCYPA